MKGMTMMASMIPAVSMPIPIGAPSNSGPRMGSGPTCAINHGSTCLDMKGAKKNSPHMP